VTVFDVEGKISEANKGKNMPSFLATCPKRGSLIIGENMDTIKRQKYFRSILELSFPKAHSSVPIFRNRFIMMRTKFGD
jgi:hypothetical protein